jgi:hypothetical protein
MENSIGVENRIDLIPGTSNTYLILVSSEPTSTYGALSIFELCGFLLSNVEMVKHK